MFIIYIIDLSTKIRCKDRGSYFLKIQKYGPLEKIPYFSMMQIYDVN